MVRMSGRIEINECGQIAVSRAVASRDTAARRCIAGLSWRAPAEKRENNSRTCGSVNDPAAANKRAATSNTFRQHYCYIGEPGQARTPKVEAKLHQPMRVDVCSPLSAVERFCNEKLDFACRPRGRVAFFGRSYLNQRLSTALRSRQYGNARSRASGLINEIIFVTCLCKSRSELIDRKNVICSLRFCCESCYAKGTS